MMMTRNYENLWTQPSLAARTVENDVVDSCYTWINEFL